MISWLRGVRIDRLRVQLAQFEAERESRLRAERMTGLVFDNIMALLDYQIAGMREKIRQLEAKNAR